jgi:hypothetical protein
MKTINTAEKTLSDLVGSVKWIGDNLGSGADFELIELRDEQGTTSYASPSDLFPHDVFNRLDTRSKTRIMQGIEARNILL